MSSGLSTPRSVSSSPSPRMAPLPNMSFGIFSMGFMDNPPLGPGASSRPSLHPAPAKQHSNDRPPHGWSQQSEGCAQLLRPEDGLHRHRPHDFPVNNETLRVGIDR